MKLSAEKKLDLVKKIEEELFYDILLELSENEKLVNKIEKLYSNTVIFYSFRNKNNKSLKGSVQIYSPLKIIFKILSHLLFVRLLLFRVANTFSDSRI